MAGDVREKRNGRRPGPRKPLTAEERERAEALWPVAGAVAGLFGKKYPGLRLDWIGATSVAVCEAAQSFRGDGGASITTHAHNRCFRACLDLMRASALLGYRREKKSPPRVKSIHATIETRSGAMPIVKTIVADESPDLADLEAVEEVARLTRCLPPGHGEVMRKLYLEAGATMKLVGLAVGLSEARVSQIHSQSLDYLRERLTA